MVALVLVRGLPGSGKTTAAKKMAISPWLMHLETDMFWDKNNGFDPARLTEAHEWCQGETARLVNQGISVIVSNTFTQRWEMAPYFDIAEKAGASVIVWKCTGDYGSIHGVPKKTIEKMRERWEPFKGEATYGPTM